MSSSPSTHCPSNNIPLLIQVASIASILTFLSAILGLLTLHIHNRQKRKLDLQKIHLESNAHVAGMQEITWAIAAVKESIKSGDDGSEEAKEVLGSVGRLLKSAEGELEVLRVRRGDVEGKIGKGRGSWGWGVRGCI